MRRPEDKVVPFDQLAETIERMRGPETVIVSTNGCFDILHFGHTQYLVQARMLGDVLICGINSDSSVRSLKGKRRPWHNESVRLLQVAALESVDIVTLFSEETPFNFLEVVRPHIHVKGGDYDPQKLPETQVVERLGGKVVCLPFVPGFSTTEILSKFNS